MSKAIIVERSLLFVDPKQSLEIGAKYDLNVIYAFNRLTNYVIVLIGNAEKDGEESIHKNFEGSFIETVQENTFGQVEIMICYHYNKNCDCRLPKIGLVKQAIKQFNFELDKSFLVSNIELENDDELKDLRRVSIGKKTKKSKELHFNDFSSFADFVEAENG